MCNCACIIHLRSRVRIQHMYARQQHTAEIRSIMFGMHKTFCPFRRQSVCYVCVPVYVKHRHVLLIYDRESKVLSQRIIMSYNSSISLDFSHWQCAVHVSGVCVCVRVVCRRVGMNHWRRLHTFMCIHTRTHSHTRC